tara:strand:- start:246 stop:509 length:264 start_codon:yes stop_codon:yes gene_type:complete
MKSSFKDFINVLNFQVSWSEANILFVLLSSLIYLSLILLMLNAIWTAVVLEEKNSENRKKIYGSVFKGILLIGFVSAAVIFLNQLIW